MIIEAVQKVKLYHLLFLIDKDLAKQERVSSCPFCGASLHASNYLRKPRGGPDNLPEKFSIRHSLCCSSENCRKRVLPPSVRFWGRKVYWGVVILVMVVLQQQRTDSYSAGKIIQLFGVSRHTLKRWIHYFKTIFPISDRWKSIKSLIGVKMDTTYIPSTPVLFFIERFGLTEGLIRSLQLLLGDIRMI